MFRHRIPFVNVVGAIAVALALFTPATSMAQQWQVEITPIRAASAILIEASTGIVLYEQDADLPRSPASIAKLMLELLVVERIQDGSLSLDDSIRVSAWASRMGGSQVYLAEGEIFPLDELMKAIAISSANDACVAVAEHIAGSDEGFVDLMNLRARQLGLSNTRYTNVHGLDDEPGEGNVTTAQDVARIARHLVTMPHVLEWSAIPTAPFRDGKFILYNTNKLLGEFSGLDGLKTGFTHEAGYCLCATAERKGVRLISVVMHAESGKARAVESARLLGSGFAQLRREIVAQVHSPITGEITVRNGRPKTVRAVTGAPLVIVLPRGAQAPTPRLIPLPDLQAPLAAGDTIGVVELPLGNADVIRVPALAESAIEKASLFQQFLGIFGG